MEDSGEDEQAADEEKQKDGQHETEGEVAESLRIPAQALARGRAACSIGEPDVPAAAQVAGPCIPIARPPTVQPGHEGEKQEDGGDHERGGEKGGELRAIAEGGEGFQGAVGFLGGGNLRQGLARIVEKRRAPGAEENGGRRVEPDFQDIAGSLAVHGRSMPFDRGK